MGDQHADSGVREHGLQSSLWGARIQCHGGATRFEGRQQGYEQIGRAFDQEADPDLGSYPVLSKDAGEGSGSAAELEVTEMLVTARRRDDRDGFGSSASLGLEQPYERI